jgi:hypothetical protein
MGTVVMSTVVILLLGGSQARDTITSTGHVGWRLLHWMSLVMTLMALAWNPAKSGYGLGADK